MHWARSPSNKIQTTAVDKQLYRIKRRPVRLKYSHHKTRKKHTDQVVTEELYTSSPITTHANAH